MVMIKTPNKKAVEIQFNWIFVLVAGGLILLFFIAIVGQQKKVSEQKESILLLDIFEQNLAAQRVSADRQDIIRSRRGTETEFFCDEIVIKGTPRNIRNTVLFAPSKTETNELLTLTKSWNMPFKVMNFVYITSPEIKYYIITTDIDKGRDLNSSLHDNATKEVVDSSDKIEYQGEEHIRLIYLDGSIGDMPEDLENVDSETVTALVINNYGEDVGATLEFYKKRSRVLFEEDTASAVIGNSFVAFGKPSLLGAVYVDSAETYDCTINKGIQKLGYLSQINGDRSQQLASHYLSQGDTLCASYHGAALFEDLLGALSTTPIDKDTVKVSLQSLEANNNQAVLSSCARLY